MTKKEYLKKLENSLSGLPASEIKDVLSDYEEHFEGGIANGRSEEDLAKSLGDPKVIAKQIKASSKIKKAERNISAANIFRAVFATAGLGFINLVFVLGPFMGLVGFLIGMFCASIGITAGGVFTTIASIGMTLAPNVTNEYFGEIGHLPAASIFFGIAMTCFGILFTIGNGYLAKWFYILTVKYLKFNAQIITGERE